MDEKLKRHAFLARQASARGGEMQVIVQGDRVTHSGRAVTVLQGEHVAC